MITRVALYVRVSTEEQKIHGISVDSQIEALQEYSQEKNYHVVNLYNDAGISARKTYKKRTALLQLLEDVKAHKIDLILFTKLDRWFRSVADYYAVQTILDANNVKWRAIQEDYETETSSGIFKVNIMLSVAQSEADRTSERIKTVFEYKRAKGEAITGTTPTGYVYSCGKWYKDKNTQKGVEAFFETYLTTFNKKLSISKAKELGVHISDETARNMLYSDKYYKSCPYMEESYITKEQHDLILANKPKCSRNNKYYYIFTGLVRCGKCKHSLSATTSVTPRKSGKIASYPMYVCDYGRRNYECTGSAISEQKLEALLLDTLDDELANYNLNLSFNTPNDNAIKLKNCKDKLERIKILFELGDLELSEYKTKKAMLLEEIAKYQTYESKEPVVLEANWKEVYNSLDVIHKNSFWRQIINYIEIPEKRANTVNIVFK